MPKYVYDFFGFFIMVMVKAKDPFVLGVLSCSPTKAKICHPSEDQFYTSFFKFLLSSPAPFPPE